MRSYLLRGTRAQGGAGTAAFVALVTLFIILWILFLPPAERDKILNNGSNSEGTVGDGRLLLKEAPETIFVEKQDEFEHQITPVNLFVVDEDRLIKSREGVLVQKTGVSIPFHVDDPANTRNAQLVFTVESHIGNLIILLNGVEVFSGEIRSLAPGPISLDGLEEDNVIEFRVSDPGWQFWKVSSYQLRDVRILATIRDLNNREAATQFSVTYTPANVESTQLRFVADCDQTQVGSLTVTLNNRVLISKTPDCGGAEVVNFDPSLLVKGTNIVDFKSERGAMLIDNIRVKSDLFEPVLPVYYFDINRSTFVKIDQGSRDVRLTIRFGGDELKVGTVSVNNRKLSFNQREKTFTKDIGQYVVEDSNFLQIIPERTLQIPEIKVELVDG